MTTDDTVTAKLAEWETLANAATEGPWHEEAGNIHRSDGSRLATLHGSHAEAEIDAAFIAATREMVPALLGFVREVLELHASSQDTRGVGRDRDGVWTPYCEEDFADWPCPTERAAQKWLGGDA